MIDYIKMLNDLTDGQSKAYIRERFEGGGYGPTDGHGFATSWSKLIRDYANELENDDDERAKLYARYLSIYKMAVDNGRAADARQILDSMAKVAGLTNERLTLEPIDNGAITITFGIKKEAND